jgi:azurin
MDAELTVLSTMVNATALIAEGVEVITVVDTGPVATADAKVVAETGTELLVGTVEKKTITIDAARPTARPMMM